MYGGPRGVWLITVTSMSFAISAAMFAGTAVAQPLSSVYRIQVKQSGRFLHVNAEGGSDQLASTRVEADDDYTRFIVQPNPNQDGSYTIRLKANNRFLHVDGLGDKLASTRAEHADDFTKFFRKRCGHD